MENKPHSRKRTARLRSRNSIPRKSFSCWEISRIQVSSTVNWKGWESRTLCFSSKYGHYRYHDFISVVKVTVPGGDPRGHACHKKKQYEKECTCRHTWALPLCVTTTLSALLELGWCSCPPCAVPLHSDIKNGMVLFLYVTPLSSSSDAGHKNP